MTLTLLWRLDSNDDFHSVVQASVTVTNNSAFQDYLHPDDYTTRSSSYWVKKNVFSSLDLELNTTKMTLAKLEKVKFSSLDQEIHEKVKKARSKPGRNLVLIWSHVTGEIVHIWQKRTSISWLSAVVRVATKNPGWVACRWRCVTSSRIPPRLINSSRH